MWYRFCYNCDHEWEGQWNPWEKCPNCGIQKWSTLSKRQLAARKAVTDAIKDGSLKRQPCEVCGKKMRIQAHHEDYTKPLEVKWLCAKHHSQRHAELRRLGVNLKRSAYSETIQIPRDMPPEKAGGPKRPRLTDYTPEMRKARRLAMARDRRRMKALNRLYLEWKESGGEP